MSAEETLQIARKAIDAFSSLGLSCCLVGGAACKIYGIDRKPNDVDIVVMTRTYGQESLKELLVRHASASFYLRPAKTPGATYKVLFAYLSSYPSIYSYRSRSCKVDILLPGIMNIPSVDAHRIVHIDAFPLMPFIPLLLLKLQAWSDHRASSRYDFQAKQYVDVNDIVALLRIALRRGENVSKEEWLPGSFVQAAKERVVRFVRDAGPQTASSWRKIGIPVHYVQLPDARP